MADSDALVKTVLELYQIVHQQLREEIADLDPAALNWTPRPETNSIGTLITHLCSSEIEMMHSVRDLPYDRDRAAEFVGTAYDGDTLLQRIDAAEATLERVGRDITADDLVALHARPDKDAPETGLFWLLRNYGHAREHLGQLQLTRQLYQTRSQ